MTHVASFSTCFVSSLLPKPQIIYQILLCLQNAGTKHYDIYFIYYSVAFHVASIQIFLKIYTASDEKFIPYVFPNERGKKDPKNVF